MDTILRAADDDLPATFRAVPDTTTAGAAVVALMAVLNICQNILSVNGWMLGQLMMDWGVQSSIWLIVPFGHREKLAECGSGGCASSRMVVRKQTTGYVSIAYVNSNRKGSTSLRTRTQKSNRVKRE